MVHVVTVIVDEVTQVYVFKFTKSHWLFLTRERERERERERDVITYSYCGRSDPYMCIQFFNSVILEKSTSLLHHNPLPPKKEKV